MSTSLPLTKVLYEHKDSALDGNIQNFLRDQIYGSQSHFFVDICMKSVHQRHLTVLLSIKILVHPYMGWMNLHPYMGWITRHLFSIMLHMYVPANRTIM